jgi:hypothetical protein
LTETGWTNDEIAVLFLRHSLARQIHAKEPDLDKPALLTYDGHGSHVSDEFVDEASKWNIRVYCLPAHTTHKLQPLDVAIFAPVKQAWLTRTTEASMEGAEMPREDIVNEYLGVQANAMEESVVRYAWKASSLVPLNPDIFTEAGFAPAQASSSITYLPVSFTSQLTSVWTRTFFYEPSSLIGETSTFNLPCLPPTKPEDDDAMDIDIEQGIFGNEVIQQSSPQPGITRASSSLPPTPPRSPLPSHAPGPTTPTAPRCQDPPASDTWSVRLVKRPRIPLNWTANHKFLAMEKYSRECHGSAPLRPLSSPCDQPCLP